MLKVNNKYNRTTFYYLFCQFWTTYFTPFSRLFTFSRSKCLLSPILSIYKSQNTTAALLTDVQKSYQNSSSQEASWYRHYFRRLSAVTQYFHAFCVSLKQALAVITFLKRVGLTGSIQLMAFFHYKRAVAAKHYFKCTLCLQNKSCSKEISQFPTTKTPWLQVCIQ